MTLFSIIVPLFNKEEFIFESIASILAQEIDNIEVIVIDDGSTDDGLNQVLSIGDPRIKAIKQSNSGVSAARNAGIENASGEFICFLDADDVWATDHLLLITKLVSSDPDAIAWATGYSEFSESTLLDIPKKVHRSLAKGGRYNLRDFALAWSRCPFFCTDSITIRRTTLDAMQPCFPLGERLGEDQDLWFRLSEIGPIRYLDVRTSVFYRRNVSDSLTVESILTPLPSLMRFANRAEKLSPGDKSAVFHLYGVHLLHVAWVNILAGRRTTALHFIFRVSPRVRFLYWIRIFFFAIFPVHFVRVILRLTHRIKPNHEL